MSRLLTGEREFAGPRKGRTLELPSVSTAGGAGGVLVKAKALGDQEAREVQQACPGGQSRGWRVRTVFPARHLSLYSGVVQNTVLQSLQQYSAYPEL